MNEDRLHPITFRFLKWICLPHLYEEIEGDLIQRFMKDINLKEQMAKGALHYLLRKVLPALKGRANRTQGEALCLEEILLTKP